VTERESDRSSRISRKVQIDFLELSGGGREIFFRPDLNLIQGEISTGKSTLVRLIRSLLGAVPSDLPPETGYVRGLRSEVVLGGEAWRLFRPLTTSDSAPVDITEEHAGRGREPLSLRLPAGGREQPFSRFLLERISLPVVSVPKARTNPAGAMISVTMTDWLGYCVIPGEEIDTQIFGHNHPFRDSKRRWVFELIYGYYNAEVAQKAADLRSAELRISALERDEEMVRAFLAATPFANVATLEAQLAQRIEELESLREQRVGVSRVVDDIPSVRDVRNSLIELQERRSNVEQEIRRLEGQVRDLGDLRKQLSSQSSRLTRAIVADEWLVDFDFVVCPRCGSEIDPVRTDPDHCYLCLQLPSQAASRDDLLSEQSRISAQITETDSVRSLREQSLDLSRVEARNLAESAEQLNAQLNRLTAAFVSEQASRIEFYAAMEARLEADVRRMYEYLEVHAKVQNHDIERDELEATRDRLLGEIQALELNTASTEDSVRALESRMLEYLLELNVPQFDEPLTVKINRKNYLPEVSGRSFDELSSQGLKTLVNIAHALAHHTVAIDKNLPLPGFLVLDGLSANAGYEGFDVARVADIYNLLRRVAERYGEDLQIIAVDNEIPRRILLEFSDRVALTLSHDNRLIIIPRNGDSD
jgi:hypothetical protein